MRTDPILLEILGNRFKAIAEEMAVVLLRTSFTVFVKETQDFGCALLAENGEVFAACTESGVSIMVGMPTQRAIESLGDYQEGDVGITNDPESTQGLATHLPDFWMWMPIFSKGTIIAYGISFIHSTDVGGTVPGSISPTNTDIYQEGMRIPPTKLVRGGVLNTELMRIMAANSRIPQENWGDIKAQLGGLKLAERRIHEAIERYGDDSISAGIHDLIDHAEERARALILAIPDGDYSFVDYMEGDVIGGAGPIRIELTLRVRETDICLDFSGTDFQVQAALNLPSYGQRGHYMISTPIRNYFRTVEPTIPFNAGLVRPIELRVAQGTILNPDPGMAVGVRAATMFRVHDCIYACLSQAVPGVVPAADAGITAIVLVSTFDVESGERRMSVAQPLMGGSGARPHQDGIDGASLGGGYLANVPNEVLESDVPVLVEHYGYREHALGAGRFRGGAGISFRMRILAPESTVTTRGLERFNFRPWGLAGGYAGRLGRATLNRGRPDERDLGKFDLLMLNPGDVLDFETPTGGGFGPPCEREPELVLRDVQLGFISPEQAESDYGVRVTDGRVDNEGTASIRAHRQSSTTSFGTFDFGPERTAYEVQWPHDIQETIIRLLWKHPSRLRPFLRRRLLVAIESEHSASQQITVDRIEALLRQVIQELGLAEMGARRR